MNFSSLCRLNLGVHRVVPRESFFLRYAKLTIWLGVLNKQYSVGFDCSPCFVMCHWHIDTLHCRAYKLCMLLFVPRVKVLQEQVEVAVADVKPVKMAYI